MQEATALDNVFAANRSAGRIALSVAAQSGVTRRRQVYEDGPLRVRFPNSSARALEAMIVNTAGGIAGGDRHDLDIAVGDGATLAVTTAAAEKVYRALGPDGRDRGQARGRRGTPGCRGCRRRPSCSTGRGSSAASRSSLRRTPRC